CGCGLPTADGARLRSAHGSEYLAGAGHHLQRRRTQPARSSAAAGLPLAEPPGWCAGCLQCDAGDSFRVGAMNKPRATQKLVVGADPTPAEVDVLEHRLYEFNAQATGIVDA